MQPYLAEKVQAETAVIKRRIADRMERNIEKVKAETAAIQKRIAKGVKRNHEIEEETKEIKRQMRIMQKYGLAPTTVGCSRCGCSRCSRWGMLASDAQHADDKNDDAGDVIDAGSTKNT